MSLKLTSVSINRANPNLVFAALQNQKNESVNVQVHIEPHQHIDNLTFGQLEHLALEAAKHLHV